jgi:PGM1 C-terminal domain
MLTLSVITEGHYDPMQGVFRGANGVQKCYYATDNLQSEAYRGLSVSDLLDAAVSSRLTFDPVTERGCVFHMLGALSEYGKVGVTCIGDSLNQAISDYTAVVGMMDALGGR